MMPGMFDGESSKNEKNNLDHKSPLPLGLDLNYGQHFVINKSQLKAQYLCMPRKSKKSHRSKRNDLRFENSNLEHTRFEKQLNTVVL